MAISSYTTRKGERRYKAVVWKDRHAISSKSFRRKIDAQEWHKINSLKFADSSIEKPKGESTTLREFFNEMFLRGTKVSEGTRMDYTIAFNKFILPRFGGRRMLSISSYEWNRFFSDLVEAGTSKARVNRVHAAVSSVYKFAIRIQFATLNPVRTVEWYKENLATRDHWSETEAQEFLSWAFITESPLFPIYQCLFETGLRISELLGLMRDCINLKDGYLEIRRKRVQSSKEVLSTTKSGKRRVIPIGIGLVSTLQKYLQGHSSEFVFVQANGKPATYDYVFNNFRKDQTSAGTRQINLHSIRHSFASIFMMKGESIYDLQLLLGHSSPQTTMRYSHLSPSYLKSKAGVVSFQAPRVGNIVSIADHRNHTATIENKNENEVEVEGLRNPVKLI